MAEDDKIKIVTVGKLLEEELCIPYYQRPYRWQSEKHVKLLLQDLFREKVKSENKYRIGTVILHKEKEKTTLNIVDGQQRLVTLSLVLYALERKDTPTRLLEQKFAHIDSKNNLKYNYNYIQSYLSNKSDSEKESLKKFVLGDCEVLKIQLTELSEAFQLFDSQNARGKDLDPADLLKAFHLREMEGVYENEKYRIVNRWEETIEKKKLNDVLGNYLFRLRNWQRNEMKYFFTKNEIVEFKGVTPNKMIREGQYYPYLNKLAASASSVYFECNQPIVNGKWFFSYVSHYTDLVDRLDDICGNDGLESLQYYGSWRVGDQRLIKLYKNVLLIYLDKFGEDQNFEKFRSLLYRWVFITRLENAQIRVETILNKLKNKNNPIHWISKWHHPELDIMEMKLKSIEEIGKNSDRHDFNEKNSNSIYSRLASIENIKVSIL